jgi:hypothetical protein
MAFETTGPNESPSVLVCLWELSNGTRAILVEHADGPRWELRIARRGRFVQGWRFERIADLMATSLAEHGAASELWV